MNSEYQTPPIQTLFNISIKVWNCYQNKWPLYKHHHLDIGPNLLKLWN